MFTGIVQTIARVFSINVTNESIGLVIEVDSEYAQQLILGASIAINGVCLTVVEHNEKSDGISHISFDVIHETMRVTNLKDLVTGSCINFERSLKVGDEIGGHQVSGHVHTTATLIDRTDTDENCTLSFQLSDKWQKYIFAKGFISINGTSLTLGAVENDKFDVHLIPETLSRTNLSELAKGNLVNIEIDQQTMTIVDTLSRMNLVAK